MRYLCSLLVVFQVFALSALGCSLAGDVLAPKEAVGIAELILHVRAVGYVTPPANPGIFSTGIGEDSPNIRFKVIEVVKGMYSSLEIPISGYLYGSDDFNDGLVPYTFVRREGRRGSCVASTYKDGGDFLLFLVHRRTDYEWSSKATNLQEFYKSQYKEFPSFSKRAQLFKESGLGKESAYTGSLEQNTLLLKALRAKLLDEHNKASLVYSPYWWALGPANEQIKPENDPWLLWVKKSI